MTSNMLEAWVVSHLSACAGVHHGVVRNWCSALLITASIVSRIFFIVVVSSTTLVCKVLRSLVFVCAAIVLEAADDLVDVRR